MSTSATQPGTLAPLLYWFPGVDAIPAAWQYRFGPATGVWGRLAGLLRGDGYLCRKGQPGPAAGLGLLVCVGELPPQADNEALRYEPARQEWCELEPGAWAGVADTAKPGDFFRKAIAQPLSYSLKSSNRGEWYIPVATITSDMCALRMVDRFERSEWRRVPSPEHAEIAAIAERLYGVELGEEPKPAAEWMRDAAIKALQVNYALTGPELALFGVLNDDSYDLVSAILTDRPARQKKTAEPGG